MLGNVRTSIGGHDKVTSASGYPDAPLTPTGPGPFHGTI